MLITSTSFGEEIEKQVLQHLEPEKEITLLDYLGEDTKSGKQEICSLYFPEYAEGNLVQDDNDTEERFPNFLLEGIYQSFEPDGCLETYLKS